MSNQDKFDRAQRQYDNATDPDYEIPHEGNTELLDESKDDFSDDDWAGSDYDVNNEDY